MVRVRQGSELITAIGLGITVAVPMFAVILLLEKAEWSSAGSRAAVGTAALGLWGVLLLMGQGEALPTGYVLVITLLVLVPVTLVVSALREMWRGRGSGNLRQ